MISKALCISLLLYCTTFVPGTSLPLKPTSGLIIPKWKVVNGRDVTKGNSSHPHPYLVSIQWKANNLGYKHSCGGAILDMWTIITAAHCFYDSDRPDCWGRDPSCYRIVAGVYDLLSQPDPEREQVSEFPSDSIQSHEQFNGSHHDYENDIALVHLSKPLKSSGYVQPISLVKPDRAYSRFNASIAGWGKSESSSEDFTPFLKEAGVTIHTNEECMNAWKHNYNPETMLCASGRHDANHHGNHRLSDACDGDSGGPLIVKDVMDNKLYLVGLVSWGEQKCGVGSPGVYTRLSKYLPWIRKNRKIAESITEDSNNEMVHTMEPLHSEENAIYNLYEA